MPLLVLNLLSCLIHGYNLLDVIVRYIQQVSQSVKAWTCKLFKKALVSCWKMFFEWRCENEIAISIELSMKLQCLLYYSHLLPCELLLYPALCFDFRMPLGMDRNEGDLYV